MPFNTLDAKVATLARQLQSKPKVVFHCALSQQRGPTAARRYIAQRQNMLESNTITPAKDDEGKVIEQEVLVLTGGFVDWQGLYGTDKRLTEGYSESLWKDPYGD